MTSFPVVLAFVLVFYTAAFFMAEGLSLVGNYFLWREDR